MNPLLLLCIHVIFVSVFSLHRSHAQTDQQDSLALVEIYVTLNGTEWDNNTGWLQNDVPSWYGVTVEGGRVTRLYLQGNNLVGTFPQSIAQLSELRELYIAVNDIQGEIPKSISDLSKLEVLSASKNELYGEVPGEIALMDALVELNLLSNDLEGPLPDLSSLQKLEVLYFDNNDFQGGFPEWLLDMPSIRVLGLRNIGLTGTVPPSFFKSFPQLEVLRLGSNNLEGDISKWFKDTSPVQSFDIYNNAFTGIMADGVIDPNISDFTVSQNLIEGIPDFSEASELKQFFYIDNNKLDFSEISKADSVRTFSPDRISLGPQKKLMTRDSIIMTPGDAITIESGSSHQKDSYQWFKNNSILPNETKRNLKITEYTTSDAGIYHCVISNPDYAFDLQRHEVIIISDESTSTRNVSSTGCVLYPNPVRDRINVSGIEISSWSISDVYGRILTRSASSTIDVSSLPNGVHTILMYTVQGHVVVKGFVKQQ